MSLSRKHHLKRMMLSIAKALLEAEGVQAVQDKEVYMNENCPPMDLSGAMADLQIKVDKCDKETEDLKIKVQDLKGKFKKPALRKVCMSADSMLQALLGSKHKVTMDLRSNLKQVKNEVKEEPKDAVGDWHQNIEDKEDRKTMFETS